MPQKVDGKAIAAEWGVDPITVRRWRKRNLIPYVRVGRRVIRYDPAAVRSALENLSARDADPRIAPGSKNDVPAQAPQAAEAAP
mgnify:FL=1